MVEAGNSEGNDAVGEIMSWQGNGRFGERTLDTRGKLPLRRGKGKRL
jgi:hypothetical protein